MNARKLLFLAALIPAGLLASCAHPNRTAVVGGLGPQYKYRATQYSQYLHSPYVPSVDVASTKDANYFNGRYLANNEYRCAPLVRYGTQGVATIDYANPLHYHTGDKYYGGSYVKGNLYRHSHAGYQPHEHNDTPSPDRPE